MDKSTNPRKFLTRALIPSISEAEFVYFSSLFISTLLGQAALHANEIISLLRSATTEGSYGYIWVLILIGLTLWEPIRLTYKLTLTRYTRKLSDKRSVVLTPPMYLALLWMFSALYHNLNQNPTLFATAISSFLVLRNLTVIFVLDWFRDDVKFQDYAADRFTDYQLSPRESMYVLGIGLLVAFCLLFVDNWITWLIIAYGAGQELIARYRTITLSKN